jgi:membrane-associated phospholipid phosphatase
MRRVKEGRPRSTRALVMEVVARSFLRMNRWPAAAVLFVSLVLSAGVSQAADPDRVEWSPDWPRVRLWEGLNVLAVTVASYEIDASWTPPSHANWRGGILFDDAIRSALRGRTASTQQTAADLSDNLYRYGVLVPYVVDVYLVALGIHENADVALQMLLINLQSLGVTGVVTLAAEHGVGRARPYTQDCGANGQVLDGSGRPLINHCGGGGDFQSFYSGHAAATATMAGLTCVHHQHLPLYGGGFADLVPCLVMIGASAATGIGRLVADEHWPSDVLMGWGIGALSGYVLPSLLHYGFGKGRAYGEVHVGDLHAVPVPQAYAGGAGLGLVGSF